MGTCELVSPSRFVVRMKFHPGAVAAFKEVDSGRYDARARLWSFSVREHDRLQGRLSPLRPEFALEPLPRWVVDVFGAKGDAERERRRRRSASARSIMSDEMGETLREGLMPFQREGVEFALKRGVSEFN